MTTLFRKITNKMIANCRNYVMEGADRSAALWEQPMMGVVARLQACLALNEGYQEQYFMTRDKLLTQPKGKQFDFNESAIFGKFDLFVRRVEKLIEMFSTVEQFSVLATHNVEGMEGLMNSFRQIVDEFKRKPYELLDYQKGQVAPRRRRHRQYPLPLTTLLPHLPSAPHSSTATTSSSTPTSTSSSRRSGFINASFENITSTEQALAMLKQFQARTAAAPTRRNSAQLGALRRTALSDAAHPSLPSRRSSSASR